MGAAAIMKPIAQASPSFKARMASVLFFLVMLTATLTEFLGQGRLSFAGGIAAGIIEALSMVAVTLLLYVVLKPANRELSLLAASLNLVGLALEAFQWQPLGVGVGMVAGLIAYSYFRPKYLRGIGLPPSQRLPPESSTPGPRGRSPPDPPRPPSCRSRP